MKIDPRKQAVLDVYGREPHSLDDLAHCVIKVIESQQNHHGYGRGSRSASKFKVAGFAWDITKGDVSNSHDCPLDGKTNWGRSDKSAPTSYPGWQGRVWIRYAEPCHSFGSGPFDRTLTHTGTGGWGSYDGLWTTVSREHYRRYGHGKKPKGSFPEPQVYSWDYRFFDADWPELYKFELFDMLQGSVRTKHQFRWEDPEQVQADAAFIADCAVHAAKKVPA